MRQDAQNHRDAMLQHRNVATQELAALTTQRNQLAADRSAAELALNALAVPLEAMRGEIARAAEVQQLMAAVVVHVGELYTPSATLQQLVLQLQDMEELLIPLESIADRVVAYTSDPNDVAAFEALKLAIRSSVTALREKLPLYPLIIWFVVRQ